MKAGWREWLLVMTSLAVGYMILEVGYRAYLYYSYAIETQYRVTTTNVRMYPQIGGIPGNIVGEYEPSRMMTLRLYEKDNKLLRENQAPINNLGWVSRINYSRAKPSREYRIAIVGDSMTASANNNLPWPDVVQRHLNADSELLARLGVDHISVINLGVNGASMQYMANPLALVARRFSADMIVVNFIVEDLRRRHSNDFANIPQDPIFPPSEEEIRAVGLGPHITINGVDVGLNCASWPFKPSNPTCQPSAVWYVPPEMHLDANNLLAVKQKAARELLGHRVLLSTKPLALMEVLGRPVVPNPLRPSVVKKLVELERPFISPGIISSEEDEKIALDVLQFIRALHKDMLVLHNPVYWYMTGERPTPTLDKFVDMAQNANIDIIRMEKYLPFEKGETEWRRWYNLPHDGHWSDYGAELYGDAVYRVIRDKLTDAVSPSRKQTAALK